MANLKFSGCVPFVGAIIERKSKDGDIELLIQTRWKPSHPSIYNGTFEFAAGVLDEAYENVYEAAAREIKEETGYTVSVFIDQDKTETLSPQGIDKVFGFRPYCCVQQLQEGRPWVGFIFRCKVEPGEPVAQEGETKDVHWESAQEVFKIFKTTPEKLFALELPAWEYYFKELGML